MKNIITKVFAGITVASLLTYNALPVFAYLNEETVYSNLDSTGKKYNSTVTTIIEDENGIKTTQEKTKEELPIETKITYFVDGKEVDSNKIAGKKGKITIKLEFENKEKREDMYVPFVVVAGLMIDNEKNRDIEIKNGKILTNGNSSIAVGMALPGMQENLGIEEDKLNIPKTIEISMNTDKFEAGNIMIYASPKLLSDLDISMNDFNEIFNQVNALDTASRALETGATSLAEGIKTLDAGAVQLDNGITALDSGIDNLKSGTQELNNGAIALKNGTAAFEVGAGELTNGINQIAAGASNLNTKYQELDGGINTLANGVNSLNEKLPQLTAGATALDNGISGLQTGINAVDNGITTIDSGLEASIASLASIDQIIQVYETAGLDIQPLIELKAGLEAGLGALKSGTAELKAGIESQDPSNPGLIAGASSLKAGSEELKNGVLAVQTGVGSIADGAANLQAGSSLVVDGISSLNSGSATLANSTAELPASITAIANGAASLQAGIATAQTGINTLSDGSKQLKAGSLSLTEGTLQLVSGSQELSNGITKFNSEGISKVVDLVNNDGKDLIRRVEKLEEISNEYTSFASKEERDDLKFIAITDSVKIENNSSDSKSDKTGKSKK